MQGRHQSGKQGDDDEGRHRDAEGVAERARTGVDELGAVPCTMVLSTAGLESALLFPHTKPEAALSGAEEV